MAIPAVVFLLPCGRAEPGLKSIYYSRVLCTSGVTKMGQICLRTILSLLSLYLLPDSLCCVPDTSLSQIYQPPVQGLGHFRNLNN